MPTPEEIKKIAREVASKIEPKKGYGGESYWIRTSTEIIEKIVEDYCIVPKSKLRTEYNKSYSAAFENTTCLDRQYARGRYQVLREIFGKSLFNEEKE